MDKLLKKLLASLWQAIRSLFNVGIPLKFVVVLCIILVAVSTSVTQSRVMKAVGGKEDYDEAQLYIDVKNIIEDNFIEDVDRASLGDASAASMVSSLGDKWSYYMSKDEYSSYKLSSSNQYTGIGMSLTKDASGGFQILSVNSGSIAGNAGLNAGMVITNIDGKDLKEMDDDGVRKLIRSLMNSKYEVTVQGQKETYTIDCTTTYKSTVVSRLEKTQAAYVQLKDFEAGSGTDAVNAIESLLTQGATALVIDVRNNPGGLDSEVQILLDYLLPEGKLFSSVDKNGNAETFSSDSICLQLPMVVLINSGTYAEAEVFAAVVQEFSWATMMGESTSGMTRIQSTLEMTDGSALRLSTRTYLTANGVDICNKGGVVPESIIYNSDESATGTTQGTTGGEQGTASTSKDEQLMQALTYLSKTANY